MLCPQCGAKNDDKAIVCEGCGAVLAQEPKDETPQKPATVEDMATAAWTAPIEELGPAGDAASGNPIKGDSSNVAQGDAKSAPNEEEGDAEDASETGEGDAAEADIATSADGASSEAEAEATENASEAGATSNDDAPHVERSYLNTTSAASGNVDSQGVGSFYGRVLAAELGAATGMNRAARQAQAEQEAEYPEPGSWQARLKAARRSAAGLPPEEDDEAMRVARLSQMPRPEQDPANDETTGQMPMLDEDGNPIEEAPEALEAQEVASAESQEEQEAVGVEASPQGDAAEGKESDDEAKAGAGAKVGAAAAVTAGVAAGAGAAAVAGAASAAKSVVAASAESATDDAKAASAASAPDAASAASTATPADAAGRASDATDAKAQSAIPQAQQEPSADPTAISKATGEVASVAAVAPAADPNATGVIIPATSQTPMTPVMAAVPLAQEPSAQAQAISAAESTQGSQAPVGASAVRGAYPAKTSATQSQDAGSERKKRWPAAVAAVAVVAACAGVGMYAYNSNKGDITQVPAQSTAQVASSERNSAMHDIILKIDAPGYTEDDGKIPVRVSGTTADGRHYSEDAYVDAQGRGISVTNGQYTITVIASPLMSDGTVFEIPSSPLTLNLDIDASQKEYTSDDLVLKLEPIDAEDITDDQIDDAYDYGIAGGLPTETADEYREAIEDAREKAGGGTASTVDTTAVGSTSSQSQSGSGSQGASGESTGNSSSGGAGSQGEGESGSGSSVVSKDNAQDYAGMNESVSAFVEWPDFVMDGDNNTFARWSYDANQLANWAMWYVTINGEAEMDGGGTVPGATQGLGSRVEGESVDYYPRSVDQNAMEQAVKRLTGKEVSFSDLHGTYESYEGRVYEGTNRESTPALNTVALIDSCEDAGDGIVRVYFTTYRVGYSDQVVQDSSWYSMQPDELVQAMKNAYGSDDLYTRQGTALLQVEGDSDNRTFKLAYIKMY